MKCDCTHKSGDDARVARQINERSEAMGSSRREVEAELEHLREENRILRESARFFGELSERLNAQLHEKRAHQHGNQEAPSR